MRIVIVDSGCANLASIRIAVERLGHAGEVIQDPAGLAAADRVILPGVGAAPYALAQLRKRGFDEALKNVSVPTLGICLGMQLLVEGSDEHGGVDTLGLIPGRAEALTARPGFPVPHMGWNRLENISSDCRLLDDIPEGASVYFVHSFAVPVNEFTVAKTMYGSVFSAVMQRENFMGCQFHPEKSGRVGACILSNFLEGPC